MIVAFYFFIRISITTT